MNRIGFFTIVIVAAFLLDCERSGPELSRLETGIWRATLEVPGGDLPFSIEFAGSADQLTAAIINGDERIEVPEISRLGSGITLSFPAFNSIIEARLSMDADGVSRGMRGHLTLIKRGGVQQVMAFSAKSGETYRFFESPGSNSMTVGGRWAVKFFEDDGTESRAVGEFLQQGSRLSGTFMTPTGDYRYLAGDVADSTVYLSCFDGSHVFLFKARVQADNSLQGDFWSGTAWHESWTAARDDAASLPDAYQLTHLKDGYEKFTFSFPDVDGLPVSIEDERFRGKVVVVQIAGSWCPNCHDETAFLAPYYKKNRNRGFEIIGLMYEHYREFDKAAVQVRRFRKKFDLDYTLLIAGYSSKADAAETLPMLDHILSFPTTIFVDKSGRVRKIHTGFSGPGTGENYTRLVSEFESFVEELLAE